MSPRSHEPSQERRFGRVVALPTIVAISMAALTGCAVANAEQSPKPTHSHSAEATPTTSPETLTVQSVEIPANLTPEQMGEAFIDRLSSWEMAGATEANRKLYIAEGAKTGNADAKSQEIAQANGEIYAEALFGPNWKSDSSLATFIPNYEDANAEAISKWFKTITLGKTPYSYSATTDPNGVTYTKNSNGSISERIAFTENDNAGLTNQKEIIVGTFTNVNGAEIISNFDVLKQ